MSKGQIDFQDVLQLVELIKSSSNFSEMRLRSGDVEVELRHKVGAGAGVGALLPPATAARVLPEAALVATQGLPTARSAAFSTPEQVPVDKSRNTSREGATVIKSPMVGTVYRAPEPGAVPFVQLGQAVSPSDRVCIVEVMKLMNSINAGCHGVVTEILVADGEAVEPGQELFVIAAH